MPDRAAYSCVELAHALGVHPNSIRRRVADGTIRSARIGTRVLIPATELRRLLGGAAATDHRAGQVVRPFGLEMPGRPVG